MGLSRVAVKNRMEAMENAGVIKKYTTVIDETKTPEGILFVLDVEIIPEEYENVVESLAKDRFLRQIYNTTGDCRIHCTGFVPKTVQTYLGHASLQMTMDLYTTVFKEFKESEMEKLQNKITDIEKEADEMETAKYEKWTSQNTKKVVNFGVRMTHHV